MDFFNTSFWQGFVGNLLATIIGVAVGIPVAFWINRKVEADTERGKRQKIMHSLHAELQSNKERLIKWQRDNLQGVTKSMYGAFISHEVWDTFSDGGELQWIKDVYLLEWLARTYGNIKRIRYLYDAYLHWHSLAGTPEKVIDEDLWQTIELTLREIDGVLRVISKDLVLHEPLNF
jgi:hypothetical protein